MSLMQLYFRDVIQRSGNPLLYLLSSLPTSLPQTTEFNKLDQLRPQGMREAEK